MIHVPKPPAQPSCRFQEIEPGVFVCPVCDSRHVTAPGTDPKRLRSKCRPLRKFMRTGELVVPPPRPTLARKAWSLVKAIGAFVAKPGFVPFWEYHRRLAICDACPRRNGEHCGACGCNISIKAKGKAWKCPLEKWPGQANYVPDYLVDAGDRGTFDLQPSRAGEWSYRDADCEVSLRLDCHGWTCGLWFRDQSGAECRGCYYETDYESGFPLALTRFSDPTSAADGTLPATVTIEPVR
jgi:hypothetical protein